MLKNGRVGSNYMADLDIVLNALEDWRTGYSTRYICKTYRLYRKDWAKILKKYLSSLE